MKKAIQDKPTVSIILNSEKLRALSLIKKILEDSGWGTRVYLWQMHVDIWQNQYNIVKLKNKIKKRENFDESSQSFL